jgi:hypothetical protein
MEREKKKTENKNVYKNSKRTYVYIADTDINCDLFNDKTVLSSGRTPHEEKNSNSFDYNQNLVISPEGAQRQDGLTVSCKVTMTLIVPTVCFKLMNTFFQIFSPFVPESSTSFTSYVVHINFICLA